ncbi:hypothetical protein OPV22_021872 [Ensete ventricosum]|uniref:Uncharacterized protein n=1 Tax=Ensete ventricosum TaxID=4639 RepID=A0AAV8PBJ1_ENSVE|nr:hypothetical protein OPV22_021872 [Ensete ventricosum]
MKMAATEGTEELIPSTKNESVNKNGCTYMLFFFASFWCIKGNSCDIAPGYNVKKSFNSSDPGYEGMLDKGEDIKESKAAKKFHTALVDFVKELLKTIWKEGHSSRDAHKMIVKKAAEKVLNALQPHQVPNSRVDKGLSFGIQAKAFKRLWRVMENSKPGPSISVGVQFCTQISAHGSDLNVWWAYINYLIKSSRGLSTWCKPVTG